MKLQRSFSKKRRKRRKGRGTITTVNYGYEFVDTNIHRGKKFNSRAVVVKPWNWVPQSSLFAN